MDPLRADAGELGAEAILSALADGSTFCFDTPTTLHRHGSEGEMPEYSYRRGYAREDVEPAED